MRNEAASPRARSERREAEIELFKSFRSLIPALQELQSLARATRAPLLLTGGALSNSLLLYELGLTLLDPMAFGLRCESLVGWRGRPLVFAASTRALVERVGHAFEGDETYYLGAVSGCPVRIYCDPHLSSFDKAQLAAYEAAFLRPHDVMAPALTFAFSAIQRLKPWGVDYLACRLRGLDVLNPTPPSLRPFCLETFQYPVLTDQALEALITLGRLAPLEARELQLVMDRKLSTLLARWRRRFVNQSVLEPREAEEVFDFLTYISGYLQPKAYAIGQAALSIAIGGRATC